MEKWYLQPNQMLTLENLGIDIKKKALLFIRTGSEGSPLIGIYESRFVPLLSFHTEPVFTVHDLLRLLPHVVNETHPDGVTRQYFLEISYHEKRVGYSYPKFLSTEMNFPSTLMEYHDREEFIDALYKMLCWVLSGTDYLKRPYDDRTVVTIGSSPMRES